MSKSIPSRTGDRRVDKKLDALITIVHRQFDQDGDYLVAMFLCHRIREAAIKSTELDRGYVEVIVKIMTEAHIEIAERYFVMLKTKGDPLEDILGPLIPE